MHENLERLDGIKLLVPPLDLSRISDQIAVFMGGEVAWKLMEATQDMIDVASDLGAKIIKDETGDPDFHRSHLADPQTFSLEASGSLVTEEVKNFFETSGTIIKQPLRTPYLEYKDSPQFGLPIVLASSLDGGQAKYLIEDNDQLDRFNGLNKYFHDQPIDHIFEAREYIPTPSEHFTSYRIITSATGEAVAAGLLYSDHKSEDKKIVEVPNNTKWHGIGCSKTGGLENPTSPYFLNAIDMRSNIQQGGHCIPLMGRERARAATPQEEQILTDHDVAPYNIEVPEKLLKQAQLIGKSVGKYFGLAVGIDFLQHQDTGDFYFLEANAGPGGQTFLECWFNGDNNLTSVDAQRALLASCFASLANSRITSSIEKA